MVRVSSLTTENGHHNSVLSVGLNAAAGIERNHLRSSCLQTVYGQRLALQVCSYAHDMQHTQRSRDDTPLMLLRRPPHTFDCSCKSQLQRCSSRLSESET